jgi:hypothetical protein
MNTNEIPKSEDQGGDAFPEDDPMGSTSSTPSNPSPKEEIGDHDRDSQDDSKDSVANATQETGGARMSLRDRRNRKPASYKYAEDVSPVGAIERKTSARSGDRVATKSELSNWLQCDSCHKWRLVAPHLFNELKKNPVFNCRNLQGVTCKDRDDWAGSESMAGSEDSHFAKYRSTQAVRRANNRGIPVRVNIFAGRYIPGFAGEFSEGDD